LNIPIKVFSEGSTVLLQRILKLTEIHVSSLEK